MLINEKNYLTIQGWMRTELNLSGNDLLVYAIIYGFSQVEGHNFNGSLQYLADWCGATKQGIQKNLKSLIEKGLINKNVVEQNNIKFCEYSCIVCNKVVWGMQQSCINNIDNNIDNNKDKVLSKDNTTEFLGSAKKTEKKQKENLYTKCVNLINDFTDDEILKSYLIEFLKMLLENSRETGYQIYTNSFKGKLNKLKKLSEDNYTQRKIVLQTLDNGWNGFYPLKEDKKTKNVARDIEQLDGYVMKQGNKNKLRRAIENGTTEQF